MRVSVFLSSIAAVLAGDVSWKWTPCDNPAGGNIVSITTNPGSPHLGSEFTAEIKMSLKEDVAGGSVNVSGHHSFVPIKGKVNICKTHVDEDLPMGLGELHTAGFQCPAKAGDVSIELRGKVSDAVRWVFPSASIKMTATDDKGTEIACVNASYSVHGWAEEKMLEQQAAVENTKVENEVIMI